MGWKNWSYWVKGGIILGLIYFIPLLIQLLSNLVFCHYLIEECKLIYGANIFAIYSLPNKIYLSLTFIDTIPSLYVGLIIRLIIYFIFAFIIGALIGWIYGKIKQKKKEVM